MSPTCLLLAALVTVSFALECPKGWTWLEGTGHCFYEHHYSRTVIWKEARDACVAAGGTLPMMRTKAERVLFHYVTSQITGTGWLWAGASDIEIEYNWKWLDGSRVEDFSVWHAVPTSNTALNCAAMHTSYGKIDDQNCNSKFRFVCMKEMVKFEAGPVSECPEGWTERAIDKKCTLDFLKHKADYKDAKTTCEYLGSTLMMPKTTKDSVLMNAWSKVSTWLGVTDEEHEGVWKWNDGSAMVQTNWHPGHPNGRERENCAVMLAGNYKTWYDVACTGKYNFHCAKELKKPVKKDECPPGFTDLGSGTCVYAHDEALKLTRQEAKHVCEGLDAELPNLENLDDGLVLAQLSKTYFWLGMSDEEHEAVWTWDNGNRLNYSAWHGNEPNGNVRENCALMYHVYHTWFDSTCIGKNQVICTKKLAKSMIPEAVEECPEGWTEHAAMGKCHIYMEETKTYKEAKRTCEHLGATLPIAKDMAQAVLLADLYVTYFWLGISDEDSEGVWMWNDGTRAENLRWNVHEPRGGTNENCAILNNKLYAGWADYSCTAKVKFYCMKDLKPKPGKCPPGFEYDGAARCVLTSPTRITYKDAKRTCEDLGATLPILKDGDFGTLLDQQTKTYFWLGMTDEEHEHVWMWNDGTRLEKPRWYGSEPNSGHTYNCAVMHTTYGAVWVDYSCIAKETFVCTKAVEDKKEVWTECPEGWELNSVAQKCVKLFDKLAPYETAKLTCEYLGGSLPIFKTQSDALLLRDNSDSLPTNLVIWLGMNDEKSEGYWIWDDGTPLHNTTTRGWYVNEPNNGVTYNCAYMNTGVTPYWFDSSCKSNRRFACVRDVKEPEGVCPPGFTADDSNRCYYASKYVKVTYKQARQACEDLGSSLPVIKGDRLRDQSNILHFIQDKKRFWLGLNDIDHEAVWRWEGGEMMQQSKWHSGQPNGHTRENCAAIQHAYEGTWTDLDCNLKEYFLCTHEHNKGLQLVDGCPEGWEFSVGDKCIRHFDEAYTYKEAKGVCDYLGGSLPILPTSGEAVLTGMWGHAFGNWWVGLTDEEIEGRFMWDDQKQPQYFRWYGSEPNGREAQNCVFSGTLGYWRDYPCTSKFKFICVIGHKAVDPTTTTRKPITYAPGADTDPDLCEEKKKSGELNKFCDSKKGKQSCKETCKEWEEQKTTEKPKETTEEPKTTESTGDSNPRMCDKLKNKGTLAAFCDTKEGRNLCKESCKKLDEEPKTTQAPTTTTKKTTTTESTGDSNPKMCEKLKKKGTLEVFCDTKEGKNLCKESCAELENQPKTTTTEGPSTDQNEEMCEALRKAGTLKRLCKTKQSVKKDCKKSCYDLEHGEVTDANPEKCAKLKEAGKLTPFYCRKEGKKICPASCENPEVVDSNPGKCKKMMADNKLTERYCKKEGKKLCKKSCENPQKAVEADNNPLLCKEKVKAGTIAKFCKGRNGKKECKKTCGAL